LSEVKDTIVKTLEQQQLQAKLEAVGRSATPVLNDEYFGPPPTTAPPAVGSTPTPSGAQQPASPPK
jgi:hypothetical protein